MEDPKQIVQERYDQLSSRYRTHYEQLSPDRYSDWLTALAIRLPVKANLSFPGCSFDTIIALYSLIHLPVAEQPDLIKNIYQWLRPGGYVLCTVGASEWTGTDSNWNQSGASMYWSHTDADTYQSWFIGTGFTLLESYFVAEGNGGHTYFSLMK